MGCPCGSERSYEQCCGPYIAGAPAPTAEALMRSRYTAYVRRDIDYLAATHDPAAATSFDRESTSRWAREATWLGLTILEVNGGGPGDSTGTVQFAARWKRGKSEYTHLELSTFQRRQGRWFYVQGQPPRREPVRRAATPGPNAPCPCGSGKKYKRCHGS